MLYVVLLFKAQSQLSLFEPISLNKLVCGSEKREEFEKLKELYAGDIAMGWGPDADKVAMIKMDIEAREGIKDKELKLAVLGDLQQMYRAREEKWEALCSNHHLAFLFG